MDGSYDGEKERSGKMILLAVGVTIFVILALGGIFTYKYFSDRAEAPQTQTVEVTAPKTTVSTRDSAVIPEGETVTEEPAEIEVIDVTGMKAADAYKTLNEAGLKYKISREESDSVPPEYVLSQNPKSGTVKQNQPIRLYISRGSGTPVTEAPTEEETKETEKPKKQSSKSSQSSRQTSSPGTYVIPGSDSRYLSYDEVSALSPHELNLALNEIYARHGRKFKSSELQDYFNSQPWYHGSVEPDEFNEHLYEYLNDAELYNIDLIVSVQSERGDR